MKPAWVLLLVSTALLGGCENMPAIAESFTGNVVTPEPEGDLAQITRDASAAYQARDWATSETLYTQLTTRMPQAGEPWFRLGNIYARTNRPKLAVAAYREAVVREPEHTKAWHNMGIVQLQQAANSFNNIRIHTARGDPLGKQANAMYGEIRTLLESRGDSQ